MSQPNEKTIAGYLKAMGWDGTFDTFAPGVFWTSVSLNGVVLQIWVFTDQQPAHLRLQVLVGFLNPRTAAPLMRRILTTNANLLSGIYFGLEEQEDALLLLTARPLEGLDSGEFDALCGFVASGYWQFAAPLVPDFQLDTQPR